ncbi:RNA pyrophosphohydrolase [Sphingorhabdus lutea]|uniref:RNA pyrophosphohydrolase n=1 Tax=Sphingorhabdus lutea TaxID=1913578 RepID=A0A1L3JF00_9SPHN|nr:RNA pyrophosphohydrolase [Sphingorhabdus lutea]APG63721.1 RNA pyrophosphohydrolase [Sphingorhabdus lutea]
MKNIDQYRPCAGIMLVNKQGLVFVGQRSDSPNSDAWQMPQGGIDEGEDAQQAAIRELQEETGINPDLVAIISQNEEELFYDLPDHLAGKMWGGKWMGQRQWWFLLYFNGEDTDINIATEHQEFSKWKWAEIDELVDMIVPFKRELYQSVVDIFHEDVAMLRSLDA